MDSRFLNTFLEVVDRGSIAEAARCLGLAPTTISQQIKALEKELGSRLFVRAGPTVRPTRAASNIIPHARRMIAEARNLASAASNTELPAGPLILGATHSSLTSILPPILLRWNKIHPQIKVLIRPGDSLPMLDQVARGDLDAAVVVHPLFALPKSCDWFQIREERLMLVTPADMTVTDPLETIKCEPYIMFDRAVVAGRLADDYLKSHYINVDPQFELDGIEEIRIFVASGLGVAILPDCPPVTKDEINLRTWELPAPYPRRKVGLIWDPASARSPLARELTRFLADA